MIIWQSMENPLYVSGTPSTPEIREPNPTAQSDPTVGDTFRQMLHTLSDDLHAPTEVAKDMVSGRRDFDPAELIIAIREAEGKLNLAVRVLNDVVSAIRRLERIQG
jgi:flagellar hook-basal body complex protein FliE